MAKIDPEFHPTKSGKDVVIREAQRVDAGKILDIWRSVVDEGKYTLRESDEFKQTEVKMIQRVEEHRDGDGSIYLVAEVDGTVIGLLEFSNGHLRRTAHSGMLAMLVDKKWRGVGVGTALLRVLLSWARANPIIEKVTLATFSTNKRAIELYKKMGFEDEGYCPRDMKLGSGRYIDSVLMYQFVDQDHHNSA